MKPSASLEKISTMALVLLITGAIDSIRNLPATALFGSHLIFFFIFSAIVFLVPVALVSAELSSMWFDHEGGIYFWVRSAFGKSAAFFTIWLQWINTMVWCPTILAFIAATLAYFIDPALAENKYYLMFSILGVFWSLTFICLSGLRISAAFAGFSTVVGMIFPMALIIILAILWILTKKPLAIDMSLHACIPPIDRAQSWVSLTAIMTSFLGMELAAVHVCQIRDPQRQFPVAMFFSVILILVTMILGSLAIAFVVPKDEINLVDGVMQAFKAFFAAFHLQAFMPVMVILLFIGSLGSMINWILSPAKGLLMAADHGFIPAWFFHKNRHGVASRILLGQACLVSLFSFGFLFDQAVNGIYWLFTSLSTELYMLMYVIMFLAALRLKLKFSHMPRLFKIPGGIWGYYLVCILGLLGCFITLGIGFIAPEQTIHQVSALDYSVFFGIGILILILPAFLLIIWRKKNMRHVHTFTCDQEKVNKEG